MFLEVWNSFVSEYNKKTGHLSRDISGQINYIPKPRQHRKQYLQMGFLVTPDKAIYGSLGSPASSQFQLEKWRSSPWGRHYYCTVNHPHAASRYPRDKAGSKQPRLHGDPSERERESVGRCYTGTVCRARLKETKATNGHYVKSTNSISGPYQSCSCCPIALFHTIQNNRYNKSSAFFKDYIRT